MKPVLDHAIDVDGAGYFFHRIRHDGRHPNGQCDCSARSTTQRFATNLSLQLFQVIHVRIHFCKCLRVFMHSG